MARILGIDLGTTNSVMAFWDGREPKIIVNDEGARLTPSVVAFSPKGETLVGQVARRQAVTNAENTIYSIKRFVGRRFSEITSEANRFPYQVSAGPKGEAVVTVRSQAYGPAEISAHVLSKLKSSAEAFLGEPVADAVITVPAYFNDAQRQATKEAGELAGLNVRRIINEPTAAALAYGLDKNRDQTVAIYDFGGGTFDISILTVGDNVVEVIATHGDTHLGGDDIDQRIIAWMLAEFRSQTGIELNPDRMMLQRLKEASERAKVDLSSSDETEINLPFLALDPTGPKHLQAVLTRPELEDLIADLVERTLESCALALEDAGKVAGDIDDVVLVGGSSRIPLVQRAVRQFFGRDPRRTVNPDEVVALGAAVQAGVLSGQ
jgi:molecular chaperone DnaK